MANLTFDPARNLTLYFRVNRTPVPQTLTFLDGVGAAFALASYTFTLNIKTRESDSVSRVTLSEGSGLVKSGNTLVVSPTAAQMNIREAVYYYELVVVNAGNTFVWLCGDAVFHNGKFDGVDNTAQLTISNTSTPVYITISGGTVGGGGDVLTKVTVSTAGGTIALDWQSLKEIIMVGSASFGTNKTVTASNTANAILGSFFFETTAPLVLTLPASFFFVGFLGGWDDVANQLTLDVPGKYIMDFMSDGTNFYVKLTGAY